MLWSCVSVQPSVNTTRKIGSGRDGGQRSLMGEGEGGEWGRERRGSEGREGRGGEGREEERGEEWGNDEWSSKGINS